MRDYKTKLPGIDRSKEPKIGFKAGSSALQMVTDKGGVKTAKRQTNVAEEAPKGFSPTNFLGGAIKGLGNMAKGAIMGGDGKFNLKDVGRLALGPMGMALGAGKGLQAGAATPKKEKYKK